MSGFVFCQHWDRLLAAATASCSADNIELMLTDLDANDKPKGPRCGFYTLNQDEITNIAKLVTCETPAASVAAQTGRDSTAWTSKWCEVWLGEYPVVKVTLTSEEICRYITNDNTPRKGRSREAREALKAQTNCTALLVALVGMEITMQ